jgi:hypothetical protein
MSQFALSFLCTCFKILDPPFRVVLHLLSVDVVEQGVDGQVAPHRVLFRCAEAHNGDAGVLGICFYGMIGSMIYGIIYSMI